MILKAVEVAGLAGEGEGDQRRRAGRAKGGPIGRVASAVHRGSVAWFLGNVCA
ncbi:hypothetical protein HC928_25690 [bacterium]|nr:hypothetical protein [bacterium]